jgi:pyridoxine/pyridoxamine 5'-phosphate oxidase
MTKPELFAFMCRHKLAVLGTIGPDLTPQSALIGVAVTPDLDIVFDTLAGSRKYRNLLAEPRCSVALGWADECTVQYEGTAEELKPPELDRFQALYFQVWPDGPARLSWPGIAYFVVRPSWIRYSDYGKNPPYIQEF